MPKPFICSSTLNGNTLHNTTVLRPKSFICASMRCGNTLHNGKVLPYHIAKYVISCGTIVRFIYNYVIGIRGWQVYCKL